MRTYQILFITLSLILLSCDKKNNSADTVVVQKVIYSGCFSSKVQLLKSTSDDLTDSLYYETSHSTMTLHIQKVYSCCGLLKDSVIIKDNVMSVYLIDKNKNSIICNCLCLFIIDYSIVNYQEKNIDFKVYMKFFGSDHFTLWKQTNFINGSD